MNNQDDDDDDPSDSEYSIVLESRERHVRRPKT